MRIAIVGCGAAARELQLPVLAGHEDVEIVALVDRDLDRARDLARAYHVERVISNSQELDRSFVDAAILCTPPFHHAPGTIELVSKGIHVLVEKPIATRYQDAVEMVRIAKEAGAVLAVSVFRRLAPATRLLRGYLDAELLGKPVSFDVEEGEVYGWPTATLGNMRRDLAGGGVLIDFGSHALDRLKFFFPGPAEIVEYRDNARGGIESDCVVRLRMKTAAGDVVNGRVELSRTRLLRNSYRVECERGTFELASNDRYNVQIDIRGGTVVDAQSSNGRAHRIQGSWSDERETPWFESFRAQIDDWIRAIRTGGDCTLSGASVLPSFKLIEDAYASPKPLPEPWSEQTLRKSRVQIAGATRRVLITGATGFIGGRLAEVLSRREGWNVRALVHNPAHASRLACLPVEMVVGDLSAQADADRITTSCDAVVHCAIGTTWGDRQRIFDVNVGGTERLAQAALANSVGRFVHLSTFAVHDLTKSGTLDESTPLNPPSGNDYAESKAEAEHAIARSAERGLCATTLRLANVYGPFSTIFITRPISHLAKGELVLVGDAARIPSSTVYVDSVVEAIIRALDAPRETINGELFTISDGDAFTWSDFYGYFARALNARLQIVSDEQFTATSLSIDRSLWRWAATPLASARDLVTSPEMWALTKRALKSEPILSIGKRLCDRIPPLERAIKRRFDIDQPVVYRRPPTVPPQKLFEFDLTRPLVTMSKAQRLLGHEPAFSRPRAMELTLEWLRHARIAPSVEIITV